MKISTLLKDKFGLLKVNKRRPKGLTLSVCEILERKVLLAAGNREQSLYYPEFQPVDCWSHDPWTSGTFSVPKALADSGGPFPTLQFSYLIENPQNTGQFFEYVDTVAEPYATGTPFEQDGILCVDLKYRHRFLDAMPVSSSNAPSPPINGEYTFAVSEVGGPGGAFAGDLSFEYVADTSPSAPSASLSIDGDLVLSADAGDFPVVLLAEEGDLADVTMSWSAHPDADYYLWQLYWVPEQDSVRTFGDQFVLYNNMMGTAASPPDPIEVPLSGLQFGVYVFRVQARNCGGEGSDALLPFVVSDPVTVSVLDNSEDICPTCPGETAPGLSVDDTSNAQIGNEDGDLTAITAYGSHGHLGGAGHAGLQFLG